MAVSSTLDGLRVLPFRLPERAEVTRLPQANALPRRASKERRTGAKSSFDPPADIVDFVFRTTERIWVDSALGLIYDVYDHACTVYTQDHIGHSVEEIVAAAVATLVAFPDIELDHLNVGWTGSDVAGFVTSQLAVLRSTHLGPSIHGLATGKPVAIRFAADCRSWRNSIHTEWRIHDTGALVRQLGLDVHEAARRASERPSAEILIVSPPTRLLGQGPRPPLDLDTTTVDGWAREMFDEIWNRRRLDRLGAFYANDAVVHSSGERTARGLSQIGSLILSILASVAEGGLQVDQVTWSDENDGVIVAARWRLEGVSRRGGALGDCPEGHTLTMMGASHLRLAGGRIVEEWTVFDEVGVLAAIYRQ